VATVLVGGLMCVAQRLLKRMLAFATVSHMGVLLTGVALLRPEAVGGAAGYVAGDGLLRAGLFAAVGVLAARHGTDDETELFGRARGEWGLMAVIVVGGLGLAGLPPVGPFGGRAMIEDEAVRAGLPWLPPVLALAGVLTGGAVLRTARTVFLGVGRPPGDERAGPGAAESPDGAETERTALLVAAALLTAAGVAWGLIPGLIDHLGAAGAAFADREGYAGAVLHGARGGTPAPAAHPLELQAYVLGAAATIGALLIAGAGAVRRDSICTPRWLRALHHLHSGRTGDYLSWLALGGAGLTCACLVALT
jgi:multicomponent Na+:H+ antiporter subunit D